MDIQIDRASAVPIYQQISRGIRALILAGKLPEGFRLPPERKLARTLGVNRTTVLNAYRELKDDALVDAHVGRGTTVLAPRFTARPASGVEPFAWRQLFREGPTAEDPLIRDLLELSERSDLISLAIGLPAPDQLPVEALRSIQAEVLDEHGATALLHSPTEGVTRLREALAEMAAARGIHCSPGEILITSGSQQALDLAARVLLEPGDVVFVEAPTYIGALLTFRRAGARLISIPTDGHGLRVDALEALLQRHQPKLIYTLPTFQNPSGSVLPADRRRRLIELAHYYQVPILEDDVYYDLCYEDPPPPPLKSLDHDGYVLYMASFSKVLFPGLRVGWMVAPRAVVRQFALAKQSADLHTGTHGQYILERFVREGALAHHVHKVRASYAGRRNAMDAALRAAAPRGVAWSRPAGGFYFWVRMPDDVEPQLLMAEAVRRRVAFLPGAACFGEEPPEHRVRLNFSFSGPEQIREGVQRLMDAVREVAGQPHYERAVGGTRPIV